MRLGARAHPWAVSWQGRVSGGSCDELVGGLTKRTVRTKSNGFEADIEALLFDDAVCTSILSGGVRVGAEQFSCSGMERLTNKSSKKSEPELDGFYFLLLLSLRVT